ncbi:Uncharacterized protein OS=Singulisphaera acidiphila (strain ATCC BAA-1392 / DSM 18658 / VKM B-2454 / MOB10) GN=Sinac_3967 PE=4 SV=1: PSCyt2: PSD1 [Gemmata massiliana]|uniref:Cytochrome c domain-containing protein n=1 Tax=Gemmata massiliana TaxID=1210884 RepID=A0A6P2D4D5_9BACT|nr:DUF1549 domain-containing protein [Gemmata massiliana]VTR96161.1 Uncharacterized protein OS=Singulisphaera acidiphila (strain ATCC BAA-1392 / DSM 18658 / VKM B-2454 / MOB10) GN=Sinac_3967 PE=4 SV=1: PSCyt2: PSD1 [Gemmata massiliana]
MLFWAVLIGLATGAQPGPPLGAKESPAELAAWIDAKLEANWRAKNLPVREVASDEVFLRRAYLELTGSIPSVAEARDFLESTSTSKREQLVRTLLDDKRYAEHTARQWARTLAPAGNTRAQLETWLRGEFRKNTPFDQMARSMLSGSDAPNPKNSEPNGGSGFAVAVGGAPERFAEAVGRGLLGVRLGCAQCHNHPFAQWTQEDFWGLAAFFAPTGKRVTATDGGKDYAAKFLDGSAPNFDAGKAPRAVLADWLATGENRYFAANVANRVWQDLCGTGLVSTIDDLDTLSAEERKEILDELAAKFAASGFNVRWLVEGICLSKAYQRASSTTGNGSARRPVRTLTPDQVFAALDQSLGLKKGRGFSPRYTGEGVTLMAQLEAARGTTPTDFKGGIPQALLLMNGALVTQATALDESMTLRAVVDAPFLKDTEKLDTLFLAAYSRLPRAAERERLMKVIDASPNADARKQAYSNIFWALLNSPEFVLCP